MTTYRITIVDAAGVDKATLAACSAPELVTGDAWESDPTPADDEPLNRAYLRSLNRGGFLRRLALPWDTRGQSINRWPSGAPDPLPVIQQRAARGEQSARWAAGVRVLLAGGGVFAPVTTAARELATWPRPEDAADHDRRGDAAAVRARALAVTSVRCPERGPCLTRLGPLARAPE